MCSTHSADRAPGRGAHSPHRVTVRETDAAGCQHSCRVYHRPRSSGDGAARSSDSRSGQRRPNAQRTACVVCVSAAARTRDRSETRRERPSARLFSPLSAVTSYTFGVSSKPLSVRPSTARLAVVGGRRRQEGGPTIDCTRDRTGGRRTRLARCTCFPTPTPYPASGPTCLAVARARLAASRRSRGQTRPLGPMRCAAASAARSLRRVLGHSGSRAAAAAAAP